MIVKKLVGNMHCSWIWMTISHYWGLNFYVKNKVGTLQWLGCGHCTARASMIPTFLLFFFFFLCLSDHLLHVLSRLLYIQFSSVSQSCPTLCDPMNHSTPGLPAHHQLPEFTQTRVRCIGDAIQPSHPLSSPSLPALNLSQHQGLFKWVTSLLLVP